MTRIRSGALDGIDGLGVTVEVDAGRGLPSFNIVGLPSAAVRESRERVMAAIRNSGLSFPPGRVTVNLAPADVRKQGASFDLAIAVGVVAAHQQGAGAPPDRRGAVILGELSLDGGLRPVRGLLAIALAARARGERQFVVPRSQVWEARLVDGAVVTGARDLLEVIRWWRGGAVPVLEESAPPTPSEHHPAAAHEAADAVGFLGLIGQTAAQRAAVIAAAGRHNLLMVGPPGSGKTRLARAIRSLQPPLARPEALEVMRIHSAAGTLRGSLPLRERPFRAPHHTVTRAGLIGGGASLHPGEVTLSHRGVLFLDELAEYSPAVLDALREPLEEGLVAVARGTGARIYPARFQLVAAMNPCRCGFLGSSRRACACPPQTVTRYRGRLSGPLLDRIDLFVEMTEPTAGLPAPGSQVDRAQEWLRWRALRRDIADAWSSHAQERRQSRDSETGELRASLQAARLEGEASAYLESARAQLGLSIRGVLRCLRVARTIARLAGSDTVARAHLAEALRFRREALPGWTAEGTGQP